MPMDDHDSRVVVPLGETGLNDESEISIFQSGSVRTRKTIKAGKGQGPSVQADVSFENLSASANGKFLLKEVSGLVSPKECTWILGPSGCGKSTLLNILANRSKQGVEITGNVLFNSRRLKTSDRRQLVSYVAQDTALAGEFTVRETLFFYAQMYFGVYSSTRHAMAEKIEDVILSVGLKSCEHVRVGSLFFRGLSGGQKKRLAIAIELISSPSVLICDEPTSGLDSNSALGIVKALGKLAGLGHTIIATIHSPSSKIWSMFGNVMLLSQGRLIYFGPSNTAIEYFSTIGMPRCPDDFNPADYLIACLSTDFPQAGGSKLTVDELAEAYAGSSVKRSTLNPRMEGVSKRRTMVLQSKKASTNMSKRSSSAKFDRNVNPAASSKDDANVFDDMHADASSSKSVCDLLCCGLNNNNVSSKQIGFATSFYVLLKRDLRSLYKNPGIVGVRLVLFFFLGIVLGLAYLNEGTRYDAGSIYSRASVCCSVTGFFSFMSVAVMPFVVESRDVFKREHRNGAYPAAAFVLAKCMSLIPIAAMLSIVASLPVVFMINLEQFGKFFLALLVLLLCTECFVQFVGCAANNYESGVTIAIGTYGVFFLTSGFFVVFEDIHWAVRWIGYVSPIRYAFRAFMRNEFEALPVLVAPQYSTGEDVLNFFGINEGLVTSYWGDLGFIMLLCGSYVVFMWLTLLMS